MEERGPTQEEIAGLREKAAAVFQDLEVSAAAACPNSWIQPDAELHDLQKRSDKCRYFDTHGFLHIPGFCDQEEVGKLKQQMKDLADHEWNPGEERVNSFGTDAESNQARGDYFLDSSNRIHFFAEPTALDDHGYLKADFQTNKVAALNKSGHAMHIVPGSFRDYTLSDKIFNLVTDLGWKDPVVPQSMYIFKQPQIGGTVHSHQDSSFLFTHPKQSCLGLWLALDDATLENGCLWVRPGSHAEPVRRQFARNREYFEEKKTSEPKLTFLPHEASETVSWEGSLPESLEDAGFVPVECKAGDLLTFCGTLDHLSLPNFSKHQRHTFQLHLVEGPSAGVTWVPENWLQYPKGQPFLNLRKGRQTTSENVQ